MHIEGQMHPELLWYISTEYEGHPEQDVVIVEQIRLFSVQVDDSKKYLK